MFKHQPAGGFQKTVLGKFKPGVATTTYSVTGDADNDGRDELVVASGTADRVNPGMSYTVMFKREAGATAVAAGEKGR